MVRHQVGLDLPVAEQIVRYFGWILPGHWAVLSSALSHLVLPALVIAAYPLAVITRMVRASVLDTLGEDHVRMVRALGFSERSVFGRFAMKLAWNPVVAVLALVFAYSL